MDIEYTHRGVTYPIALQPFDLGVSFEDLPHCEIRTKEQ